MSFTVLRSLRRLRVLNDHLASRTCPCSGRATQTREPCISITPSVGMVDEKVKIHISGLAAQQKVTIVADLVENGVMFESRSIQMADSNGEIDNYSTESLDGTYTGVEPMGLFWSFECLSAPKNSTRLVKKDVSSPMNISIRVYPDTQKETVVPSCQPILETKVQRFYKKPGVKRIPLTGRFKGAIFIPEGDGPFSSLIDMFGGVVSIIETRAALLASHGYATMALSYLYQEGLPDSLMSADFGYIKNAYEWFIEQEFVDKSRLGAIGLCYGGFMSLYLTSLLPQIRAVVNVNGISMSPYDLDGRETFDNWLLKERVFNTDEGIVITDIYDCANPNVVPAWQHGAKILIIVGEDDKQVHPKWHTFFVESCPPQFKQNIQIYRYPGAGHMIEPPYSPHARALIPGRKRMSTIEFIPEKFYDEPFMAGGWPTPHAHAQEDSWGKILKFLDDNLKKLS